MAILQTEGIVLKTFDLRETSRIATFFTKDYGKVSGVLKGIRKDPKKFGSSVDRFSVNDIVYYQYRNSELHLISQCDLKQFFYPIRQDLRKSFAAHYALELVNLVMPPEQRNRRVYSLLQDFLITLTQSDDIHQLVHVFQIKILLYSGFRPHLDACLNCHQDIEGNAKFSLTEGGLVCYHCAENWGDLHDISRGTISSLIYIEKNLWPNCMKLMMTSSVKKELKYILNNFLVFHLGRKLKSAKYLH